MLDYLIIDVNSSPLCSSSIMSSQQLTFSSKNSTQHKNSSKLPTVLFSMFYIVLNVVFVCSQQT